MNSIKTTLDDGVVIDHRPIPHRNHCCYIAENGTECSKEAEFEAFPYGTPDPYQATHSCADHLGLMLDDNPHHWVSRLPVAQKVPS